MQMKMEVPTPSLATVNLELFEDVLGGEVTDPVQGTTTAMSVVTDLVTGIERGGVAVTFRSLNSRFASAQVAGRLSTIVSSLVQLGLERTTSSQRNFWDLSYLRFRSGLPGINFEIDFFPATETRSLDVQGEQIDLLGTEIDYAREQIATALTTYLKLLGARRAYSA